jgi:hypothetical protein
MLKHISSFRVYLIATSKAFVQTSNKVINHDSSHDNQQQQRLDFFRWLDPFADCKYRPWPHQTALIARYDNT